MSDIDPYTHLDAVGGEGCKASVETVHSGRRTNRNETIGPIELVEAKLEASRTINDNDVHALLREAKALRDENLRLREGCIW